MLAWLETIGIKAVLSWIWDKLSAAIILFQKDQSAHKANVDQAVQDVQKSKDLTPESTAKDVDNAIDDFFKHF